MNIVTGVIGSDAHIIGNRILQIALTDAGYNVISLGILVSQEEFIAAAIETNSSAILVSSLYGMGEIDCQGFRDKCIESGLDNITLYVGGNLGLGKKNWSEIEEAMLQQGFNKAFPPDTMPEDVIKSLDEDLLTQ
ncbi:MAG: methylaspartate mutase subunit S [Bacteroidetes bacterium]|nr:MAG: methylaspartate mutase subunit S [Bacteroidota bacterium]